MKRFPVLLFVVLGVGLLAAMVLRQQVGVLQPAAAGRGDLASLRSQDVGERVWKEVLGEKALVIGSIGDDVLQSSSTIRLADAGELYVLDGGARQVKRFSPGGELITTYGSGHGQGPGEFSYLTDFMVADDGGVWAVDPANGRITVFDTNGEVQRIVALDRAPYRLLSIDGDGVGVMFSAGGSHLFGRLELAPDGRGAVVEQEFGKLLAEQERYSLVLDGRIAPGPQGDFFYVPFYFGALGHYGADGQLRYFTETISPVAMPNIVQRSDGFMSIDPDAPEVTESLFVFDDDVFVLGPPLSVFDERSIVDVYARSTGAYRYSFHLPGFMTALAVETDFIYTSSGVEVTKWERL